MSMFDYYISILTWVCIIFAGLALIGAFCSVGWMISDRELKKERSLNNILHSKVKSQANEIETLRAKNNFLLNRVSEVTDDLKQEVDRADKLMFEKVSVEDKLHKALAACHSIAKSTEA